MRRLLPYLVLTLLSLYLFACSSNVKLIQKSETKYGKIKFYIEKQTKDNTDIKRIYASVDSNNNKNYYSFYHDRIVRITENAKTLTYIAFYGQLPTNYNANIYQKFSSLDSLVLIKGDRLLGSLGLKNFKRSTFAEAYQIEVSYYHGYPKNKKFQP